MGAAVPLLQLSEAQGVYDELARHALTTDGDAPAAPAQGAKGQKAKAKKKQAAGQLPPELLLLPDVAVGYNMGLTCPDYDWQPTLAALQRYAGVPGR